uniref:RNA polymerase II-associated protein 3 n=2 Tax=Mesocestoides corti TaxID=53468 RepID=A0A5K3FD53_MESCO
MDGAKFLEMRKQIEENNQDIQDFLGDMNQWRSCVEKKNAKLRAEADTPKDLPLVRNILHKKKRKKVNQTAAPKNSSVASAPQRIKSYDYKAWDSFDVDKALEDLDKPEIPQPSEESETDDEWENERRLRLSDVEKEQGNLRFKEGKYEEAIEHYTTSIQLAPELPLLYTNRALALYKLERFASAETDCSMALSLNPRLVKALYRRAQSRRALGKDAEAVADLKRILDIEPHNSTALKDLRIWTGDSDLRAGSVNSIFKLVDIEKAASADLHRVQISEVGTDHGPKPSGDADQKRPQNADFVSEPSPGVSGGGHRDIPQATPSAVTPMRISPTFPKCPPTNWFQMDRDLRELVPSGQTLTPIAVEYLCSIEPANYSTVIGQNLDSLCLGRLLSAISLSPTLSSVQKAERLAALAKLPRFDVAWLLAEDADREKVENLLREVSPENSDLLKRSFI